MAATSFPHPCCSPSQRCGLDLPGLIDRGTLQRCQLIAAQDHVIRGLDGVVLRQTRSRKAACASTGASWVGRSDLSSSRVASAGSSEAIAAAAAQCSQLENSQAVVCTEFIAETLLPTSSGKYRLRGYRHSLHTENGSVTVTEPSVIMTGNPEGQEEVVVRVHDACFTSEVLGSLKCDCADQLQLAMDYIQENPGGLIIYLQQEGRGIGLANKIAAYALQEQGFDTVDANRRLGLPDDCREYTSVQNILADLDIKSIRLMTNNPRKIQLLESLGVRVTQRIPCIVRAQKHNLGYLSTKRSRMKHMLDSESELNGDFCYYNHDGEPLPGSVFSDSSFGKGPLGDLVAERGLRAERRTQLEDVQKPERQKRNRSQQ